MTCTIEYEDNAQLVAKLTAILATFGRRVELANPGTVTIRELAALVHRPVSTVSRSLRRPSCPPFVATRGRKRILWIEPNERLISWLTNQVPGRRNDLAKRGEDL